jgi:pyruvoyl-dependent arginine decarboxylase (PvlArgDC)
VGIGRTELSAFDAALANVGIGDYNLLPLSSVIPLGAELVEQDAYPIHQHGRSRRGFARLRPRRSDLCQ